MKVFCICRVDVGHRVYQGIPHMTEFPVNQVEKDFPVIPELMHIGDLRMILVHEETLDSQAFLELT